MSRSTIWTTLLIGLLILSFQNCGQSVPNTSSSTAFGEEDNEIDDFLSSISSKERDPLSPPLPLDQVCKNIEDGVYDDAYDKDFLEKMMNLLGCLSSDKRGETPIPDGKTNEDHKSDGNITSLGECTYRGKKYAEGSQIKLNYRDIFGRTDWNDIAAICDVGVWYEVRTDLAGSPRRAAFCSPFTYPYSYIWRQNDETTRAFREIFGCDQEFNIGLLNYGRAMHGKAPFTFVLDWYNSNLKIDWGDGTSSIGKSHTYSKPGEYLITIMRGPGNPLLAKTVIPIRVDPPEKVRCVFGDKFESNSTFNDLIKQWKGLSNKECLSKCEAQGIDGVLCSYYDETHTRNPRECFLWKNNGGVTAESKSAWVYSCD